MAEKLVPDSFLKNQNWAYLWINSLKSFVQFVFIVCQVVGYRNILKLICKLLPFTSYKAFLKNKKRSGTSLSCLILCIIFKEKCFSCYYLLIDHVSLSGCLYFVDIGQYVNCNCLLTRLWRHEFWSEPYLSNQTVFPTWPKSHDKNLNILRTKRAFGLHHHF